MRRKLLYDPFVFSVMVTVSRPRLRQNQPWVPSNPAVSTPLSPATR